MDITGAVDLSLLASEISMPDSSQLMAPELVEWADGAGYGLPPAVWARLQMTRLAAASVLEARLMHVKSSRLDVFNLAANPDQVTLQQLAPLQLTHHGTAGQAFEVAIADAVTQGHPEVTGLVRAGLRLLNLTADGPLSMVVLGMEKVPVELRAEFWTEVRALLPDDGKLRTGMRGRPQHVDTVIGTLAEMSVKSLHKSRSNSAQAGLGHIEREEAEERDRRSQLPRADALIVCGSDLVAVSLKINPILRRNEAWRHVPLWITVGEHASVEIMRDSGLANQKSMSPRVNVKLPGQGWYAVFRDALESVDEALERINRDVPSPKPDRYGSSNDADGAAMLEGGWDDTHSRIRISREVARTLWRMRREPMSAVTAELRRSDPGLQDLVGNFALSTEQVELTSLDVPVVVEGWHKESDNGRLVLTQQHLFRSLRGRENALVIP